MSYVNLSGFGMSPADCGPGQMYFDLTDSCLCLTGYVPSPDGNGCIPMGAPASSAPASTTGPAVTTEGCYPGQTWDANSQSCICMDGYLPSPTGQGCIHVASDGLVTPLPGGGSIITLPGANVSAPPTKSAWQTMQDSKTSPLVYAALGIGGALAVLLLLRS